MALTLEKLRQRLEIGNSWMSQLDAASSEKMIDIAKDLYNRIRGVYKDVIAFKEENGDRGIIDMMNLYYWTHDLIIKMSKDFSRPLPEKNEFDMKRIVKLKVLDGEPIAVVRQNIVFRGSYQHNVDGYVTYHENEMKTLMSSKPTPDEFRAVHLIKKEFDGEIMSSKGIMNPDLSSFTKLNLDIEETKVKKRPTLEVINLEFSDTR